MMNSSIRYCSKKFFYYHHLTKRFELCSQANRVLNSGKRYMSNVIRAGDYKNEEEELLSRNVIVPEKFNFATDIIDQWAERERNGLRSVGVPAFWHISDSGKEYKLTYGDLEYETKRIASVFEHECGIKHGDFTLVMLPKIPEFWLVNIAAIRVGFIFAPTSMMMTVKDLEYRFRALQPSHVIAHESVAEIVDQAAKTIPPLKNKIIISEKPCRRSGWFDLNHFRAGETNHKGTLTRSDETMMIYFTSGTTGLPKMVEHSYASFGLGANDYGKYGLDLTPKNIVWSMADTGWAFTAYNFFGAWSLGGCLFVHQMPKYSPTQTLQVLKKYPIDTFAAAPMIYSSLLKEDLDENKIKKVEFWLSGGEKLTKELAEQWYARTGFLLYNGYGQSENTGLINQRKTFEYRFGSMGKQVPGTTAAVVDDNGNVVGPGVTGEIVVERENCVGLFKGYRNNPEATKTALREKYYHTGDLAYRDEDGYFWFVGRKDDVINSAGYRIGPIEVEETILQHLSVAEVAVVGSPDEERGEVVKAFIVLKNSAEPNEDLVKEIQEHCKRITAPYKYPRKVEFVSELPKGISGKVQRSVLRKREKELFEKLK